MASTTSRRHVHQRRAPMHTRSHPDPMKEARALLDMDAAGHGIDVSTVPTAIMIDRGNLRLCRKTRRGNWVPITGVDAVNCDELITRLLGCLPSPPFGDTKKQMKHSLMTEAGERHLTLPSSDVALFTLGNHAYLYCNMGTQSHPVPIVVENMPPIYVPTFMDQEKATA